MFDDQFIETKLVNGESEFGLKEEYVNISKAEYDTLRESATDTGKWAFLFKCALWVWVISLLIFAYVADSLSAQIDMLMK